MVGEVAVRRWTVECESVREHASLFQPLLRTNQCLRGMLCSRCLTIVGSVRRRYVYDQLIAREDAGSQNYNAKNEPLSCGCHLGHRYDWLLAGQIRMTKGEPEVISSMVQDCSKSRFLERLVSDLALCSVGALVGIALAAFPVLLVLAHGSAGVPRAVKEIVLPLTAD